jgi:phosphoribulokinase
MPEVINNIRSKLERLKGPITIGIAGDSGSGKTTYSNGIRRLLGTDIIKTITLDGYHKENRSERLLSGKLPLDPNANNLDLIFAHLTELKQGKTVQVPIYNHLSGNFDSPKKFGPSPIIIIEGLHALYPEFLPLLDFTIYVDPSREVKWEWKYVRDVKKRGHHIDELTREMLKREAAYKRWIDFQKTSADVVIKIKQSQMKDFARYEMIGKIPKNCYKVELIISDIEVKLPNVTLPFNLAAILGSNQLPFLIASSPSMYWGKKVSAIHIDGILSQDTVESLEKHIVSLTGIDVEQMLQTQYTTFGIENEQVTAVQFAQLLIAWRFLEVINQKID